MQVDFYAGTKWGALKFCITYNFCRRDKIQAKYVELLAVAAAKDVPNSPTAVDESLFCGCPGKIVDPLTLHKILRQPPEEHIFYGAGKLFLSFSVLKNEQEMGLLKNLVERKLK